MPSADRSPSPPPSAPTASTPGPRAGQFIDLYNRALTNTLKGISYESFAACFPTIASQAPNELRAMHNQFVVRLEGFAKDEFQRIIDEKSVVSSLNKLDDLIADAMRRKSRAPQGDVPIPPHTLPASTILAAHLAPLHTSQQSQLNARIQTLSSQNAELVKTLTGQRKDIEALVRALEGAVGDLETAGRDLQARGSELSTGAREAEEVMTMDSLGVYALLVGM